MDLSDFRSSAAARNPFTEVANLDNNSFFEGFTISNILLYF